MSASKNEFELCGLEMMHLFPPASPKSQQAPPCPSADRLLMPVREEKVESSSLAGGLGETQLPSLAAAGVLSSMPLLPRLHSSNPEPAGLI